MAKEVKRSVGVALTEGLTEEQFGYLLGGDINKWLTAFLSNFEYRDLDCYYNYHDDEEDEDRPKCLSIEHVNDYYDFDKNQQVLGFHIKSVTSEGGEYDGDDIMEIFGIFKNDELVTHFAVDGHYSSYEHNEYDDKAYEVALKEVKVMQWLPKEK